MDFMEALKVMQKKKKIRRKSEPDHVYRKKGDEYRCSCGKPVTWRYSYFKAKDWEVVK